MCVCSNNVQQHRELSNNSSEWYTFQWCQPIRLSSMWGPSIYQMKYMLISFWFVWLCVTAARLNSTNFVILSTFFLHIKIIRGCLDRFNMRTNWILNSLAVFATSIYVTILHESEENALGKITWTRFARAIETAVGVNVYLYSVSLMFICVLCTAYALNSDDVLFSSSHIRHFRVYIVDAIGVLLCVFVG